MDFEEYEEKTTNDLVKYFSDVSRNSGKVTFKITYTATPGNILIHKAFQKYAFDEANNEYLAAIGKLLDNASFIEIYKDINQRLCAVEAKIAEQEAPVVQEKHKTF